MFNFFNNKKGDEVMAKAKLSKTAKVRNLFAKGSDVSWIDRSDLLPLAHMRQRGPM